MKEFTVDELASLMSDCARFMEAWEENPDFRHEIIEFSKHYCVEADIRFYLIVRATSDQDEDAATVLSNFYKGIYGTLTLYEECVLLDALIKYGVAKKLLDTYKEANNHDSCCSFGGSRRDAMKSFELFEKHWHRSYFHDFHSYAIAWSKRFNIDVGIRMFLIVRACLCHDKDAMAVLANLGKGKFSKLISNEERFLIRELAGRTREGTKLLDLY